MSRVSRALPYPTTLTRREKKRVDRRIERTEAGCWLFRGCTSGSGYATSFIRGHRLQAHRLMYVLRHGPVDPTWDIDHLCRVKTCVNPAHLEAVSHSENIARAYSGEGRAA